MASEARPLGASQRAIYDAYTVIAMVYCAISTWLYWAVSPSVLLTSVHAVAFVVIGVNYVILRSTGNYAFATHTILSVGTLVVTSLYATGGWAGSGFLWTFAYLPYAFFLAARRTLWAWVIVLFVIDIGITVADAVGAWQLPYDATFNASFYASLGVFLLCMALFKQAVQRSEAKAEDHAAELARANDELSLAQSIARMGSWSWDPKTDVTRWSPQMFAVFGLPAGGPPLNLTAFREVLHPEDRPRFEASLGTMMQTGKPVEEDTRIRLPDGTIRIIQNRVTPETDATGAVVRVLGTTQDVTDLRASEEARALASARLQEIEMLKEVNAVKTRFLNAAAHELSTPLTPIRVQLYNLQSEPTPTPDRQAQAYGLLERNVRRLSQIVEDLLESARLQSSRLILQRVAFDLAKVAEEAVANQRAVADERGVRLQAGPFPARWVEGDAGRLAQVMDNLLANALKFTPAGKSVRVRVLPGARVEVEDEGIGIAPEAVARLFQPFSQVHDVAQTNYRGTGLGLYICKGIIEAHGGIIGVESKGLGKGTTFWFTLPETEAPAAPGPEPANPSRQTPVSPGQP